LSEALIRAYYYAFNRGDREAMLSLLTDDVAHDINQGGRETGKEASASSWSTWTAATASS
jgi:ketosteroid isomerase-like protein